MVAYKTLRFILHCIYIQLLNDIFFLIILILLHFYMRLFSSETLPLFCDNIEYMYIFYYLFLFIYLFIIYL
jgi:hypothetical protein